MIQIQVTLTESFREDKKHMEIEYKVLTDGDATEGEDFLASSIMDGFKHSVRMAYVEIGDAISFDFGEDD